MTNTPFSTHLDQNPANYVPLSPITFLERAATTHPDRTAWVHGQDRKSYRDFYARCRQLGSALSQRGLGHSDVVSVMLPNVPAMLEVHYGVPMIGAVIHSINTRLDPAIIAFQLEHAQSKLVIIDTEFSEVMKEALALADIDPVVVQYEDPQFTQNGPYIGELEYENLLDEGNADFQWPGVPDEWDAIALNYTSGTTGDPKGVVYHHRGAYLMGYANIISANLSRHPVYLWTLPMFHCNGWCFPWSISVVAGTHVCLRSVRAKPIYDAMADEGVTHLCGAPIVMSTLLSATEDEKRALPHQVDFITAAAPPPESILAGMAKAGFHVTHVYGLTETYGPSVVNEWKSEWDELNSAQRAAKKARQGIRYPALEGLTVMNSNTMTPVPADGDTIGEVMFRGNIVMKGYFKNEGATNQAFYDGWFHSGDLAVLHPDGYIQLKDRSKDIIISGGENISSIEVEDALYKHPDVEAAAVVAKPDNKWGETPCAFVELSQGHETSKEDLFSWCRDHLAHYKVPKTIIFEDLPKTSTGKIQKYLLRRKAKHL
ncbi:acyl-CoA synthetase [Cohaesibacter celericrescens]|uniref:3-methylmercaptopropionyl-CoA ligase n=1 Tax=Cohaesibacter celericrescens TaxID=2067669 RepID=A0A2N5XL34_9HYPH|nr:acyl-CoA synthetase [Cohaesibacter celericrescens]PLW75246.1 acyl-CoA synthetase [Cohaesibacter celericrescens]